METTVDVCRNAIAAVWAYPMIAGQPMTSSLARHRLYPAAWPHETPPTDEEFEELKRRRDERRFGPN